MSPTKRRTMTRYRQRKYPSSKHLKTRLDPELWQAILRRVSKEPQKPGISFKIENEVWLDVLVKLRNRHEVPGVLDPGLTIENPDPRSREGIVTGAVRAADIETLRKDPNVISLKSSRVVAPAQETFLVPSPPTLPPLLPDHLLKGLDGRGVLVGVVDFGCDFAHPSFRDEQGESRLLYLWDQQGKRSESPGKPFSYGQELTKEALDRALQPEVDDPYDSVGYRLSADAHGTPVLDIAAGNGRGTGLPVLGKASKAHLIFVDLGEPSAEEDPLNDRRVLDAVGYIFQKADERNLPAVVNLSLGLFAGPHDGRSLLELGLDWLQSKPERSIVVAAGNARDKSIHATDSVPAKGSVEILWQVFPNGHRDDECEIWYPGSQKLEVTLKPPQGVDANTQPVKLRQIFELRSLGQLVGHIIHEQGDPNNSDNQIKLRVPPTGQSDDVWTIRLENPGDEPVSFHAWIERDDQGQSRFQNPDPSFTLGSLACGFRTLVVGGHGMDSGLAAAFSGVGPTRDGRYKPELGAPAVDVLAAKARSSATRTTLGGTSAAAPHVTGLVALLYQMAGPLAVDRARALMTGNGKPWDSGVGFGSIDSVGILDCLRPLLKIVNAPQPEIQEVIPEGNGQGLKESWQAQLVQQLLAGAAAGKIRITFEIDPRE